MRVIIHDASVLIDLATAEILELFMSMPFEMMTTDFVVNEIGDSTTLRQVKSVIAHGFLHVLKSDNVAMSEIQALNTQRPFLSFADCSVFFLSKKRGAMLLTGDGRLRKEAENNGLEVHGTLWVFDLLVDEGKISTDGARARLTDLLMRNPRLPSDACEIRLKKWAGA